MKKFLMLVLAIVLMMSVSLAQEIGIVLNGEKLKTDVAPLEIEGRVMVPVRVISEKLGATVDFNFDTNQIKITRNNNIIELTLESKNAYINKTLKILDVPAKEINNRTLVPIRFVGESLGANVAWDDETWSVYITSSNQQIKPIVNPTAKVSGLYEADKLKYTWNELITSGNVKVSGNTITGSNGNLEGELVIDKSITSISEGAFSFSKIAKIEIPNSMTKIDNGAFWGAHCLTDIKIPTSVISIGERAFDSCVSLENIEIPSTVKNIGAQAFGNCANLKKVQLPSGITTMEEDMFSLCSALIEVEIPSTVKSIGGSAFINCENLIKVEMPNSITTIGEGVFYGCSNLEYVRLSDNIKKLSEATFGFCEKLISLEIPSSVEEIDESAFGRCNNLQKIELKGIKPPQLISEDVKLPSSITQIVVPKGYGNTYKKTWTEYANLIIEK